MERFTHKCEQYFRINFISTSLNNNENRFNFQGLNLSIIKERVAECIIAFDPGYMVIERSRNIQKSGKKTFGLGSYWSGCAGKVKRGLDICGFAAVDTVTNTAFHLSAIQTVTATGMYFISRLRDDAVLFYPNISTSLNNRREPKTGKRGRPKKYAGRVNAKEPDMKYFTLCYDTKELKVYNALVFSKSPDQFINLSIAVFYRNDKEVARKLYFSTDLKLDGMKVVTYCRSRFQTCGERSRTIEFLYRDARQYCGLEDCQVVGEPVESTRSKNKLNFHFNASLTSVNFAKLFWLDTRQSNTEPFSMANIKTLCHNKMLVDRFIRMFAINPNTAKNQQKIKELYQYGLIAA
jgi:hypothetical protein